MKRILVANRGEIAHRIIKTINKLGHTSVALKLPEERSPYYLENATEVLTYKSNDPRLSFLDESATIDLALKNKIDLIHPGYGFLSESGTFAKTIEATGILFIGPSSECLFKLGDKISAKKLASECDIPIIKGFTLESGDIDSNYLNEKTKKLTFPLIIKAGAGGGGRGMRIAKDLNALFEQIPGARLEAKRNFGNDELFIETFLENVRHIEVQVIGDKHGSQIHLFERDCSLQRRFQKVIEIAPAPGISESLRAELYMSSLKLAKKSGLTNASTFEFLVNASNESFYFIEANPRLQVEHTITEEITGLDIVELQINSALELPLPAQEKITKTGFSVQARLCAEIPEENFSPAVGRIGTWLVDNTDAELGVRKDVGYASGETIGTNFDSLLAKIVVTAESLNECLNKLALEILPKSVPDGVRTNIPFLISLLENLPPENKLHTKWIENSFLDNYLNSYKELENKIKSYAPILYKELVNSEIINCTNHFSKALLRPESLNKYDISLEIISLEPIPLETSKEETSVITKNEANYKIIQVNPQTKFVFFYPPNNDLYTGSLNGILFYLGIKRSTSNNLSLDIIETELNIKAPLPGTIIAINCKTGESVLSGTPILSIESMKTEHKLCPPIDCIIEAVNVTLGTQVQKGEVLVQFRPLTPSR